MMAATKSAKNSNKPQVLTEQQRQAALLIATGLKAVQVASEVGISQYQLSRWRQTSEFKAEVNYHLNQVSSQVKERLLALSGKAVDVLDEVLSSANASNGDRIKAAVTILQLVGVDRATPAVKLTSKLPTEPKTFAVVEREEAAAQQKADDLEFMERVLEHHDAIGTDWDEIQSKFDEFENYKTDLQRMASNVPSLVK